MRGERENAREREKERGRERDHLLPCFLSRDLPAMRGERTAAADLHSWRGGGAGGAGGGRGHKLAEAPAMG